jgi:shikimate dehydrogenase
MEISGATKVIAIFGHPVSHSLSPAMHNSAFRKMGIDYCYIALDVHPSGLRAALEGVREMNFAGLNITVPHKETVMPMLDKVDPEASFIGAVNTIVNRNGKLIGYNTDGRGFMRSLEEESVDVEGKRVLLVGAGGAARAVSWYLAEAGSGLSIYNRTAGKAELLVGDLAINYKNVRSVGSLEGLGEADIVINSTSLGLKVQDPLPFDPSGLKPGAVVVDLIYQDTPLIQQARQAGHKAIGGLGMLLWQGVLASELWTGQIPPHEHMKDIIFKSLA